MEPLKYDRQVTISIGSGRKATFWTGKKVTLTELYQRFEKPTRGQETLAEYFHLPKDRQDELKDVGGFVGGTLEGGRRCVSAVKSRSLVALDADSIQSNTAEKLIENAANTGCSFAVYSTRKHTTTAPRLRFVFPLSHDVSPDEYEPISRMLACRIGIDTIDQTCYRLHQLMYWPSCCKDGEYIFQYKDAPLASPEKILRCYADWRDITSWPRAARESDTVTKTAKKQEDPKSKEGAVGTFCRAYENAVDAVNFFCPGTYDPVDGQDSRYTFTEGSTSGGVIVYNDGAFLYSHHATDPCSEKLCNSFDAVRLHKFGHLDEGQNQTGKNAPSYKAMISLIAKDKRYLMQAEKERQESAEKDFEGLLPVKAETPTGEVVDESDIDWAAGITYEKDGKTVEGSINNCVLIISHRAEIAKRFGYDEFSRRTEILEPLPWDDAEKVREMRQISYDAPGISMRKKFRDWSDFDMHGLYAWFEKNYTVKNRKNIDSAFYLAANAWRFHPVKQYLYSVEGKWDGTPRIETLFVDYLGAEDTEYTREVTKKILVNAVHRILLPGCKWDYMVILCGGQGIGKSTILRRLGKNWHTDSIRTFEGKEAQELLENHWIVEICEMNAFRRTDASMVKQFVGAQYDSYRAAYARNTVTYERQCVFFGTCNDREILTDTTGNRRYPPIDCFGERKYKSWEMTDDTVDQIWAEAVQIFNQMIANKESFDLSEEAKEVAKELQTSHMIGNPWEDIIFNFLDTPVPQDWYAENTWPIEKRMDYYAGHTTGDVGDLMSRKYVTIQEIWVECLNGMMRNLSNVDRAKIKECILRYRGDEGKTKYFAAGKSIRNGCYGVCKGYIRQNCD